MKLKVSVAISLIAVGLITIVIFVGALVFKGKSNSAMGQQTASGGLAGDPSLTPNTSTEGGSGSGSDQTGNNTNQSANGAAGSGNSNSSNSNKTGNSTGGTTTGGSSSGSGGTTSGGTTKTPSIASFAASPSSVSYNSASTLSWSSANTTTCTISPSLGTVATSGSKSTGNLTSSTTYTLSCNGVTKQASVTVGSPPSSCGQSGGVCTASQVATHNTQGNCWVIYNGYYYIVTNYVTSANGTTLHPGGRSVFNSSTCGHDITSYMNGSASTAGQQHRHGSSAYTVLNSYRVGQVQG